MTQDYWKCKECKNFKEKKTLWGGIVRVCKCKSGCNYEPKREFIDDYRQWAKLEVKRIVGDIPHLF